MREDRAGGSVALHPRLAHTRRPAGIRAAPPSAGAYVLALGDMPAVSPSLVDQMIEAWRRSSRPIVAPSFEGRRGHPVVVSASVRRQILAACKGDKGLRDLLEESPELLEEVPVQDPGCLFDVDVPEDLL
jgi:molybdenum cofactor cytidylyltransferase